MKKAMLALLGLTVISVSAYAQDIRGAATPGDDGQQVISKSQGEGDAFLAANKLKPGVVTLPSGLQYKILTRGSGKNPTDADMVEVDYEGMLINGKVFDSSYTRGQPASFGVTQVIPGWTEILKLMPAGSTWMVYIPASLAYGEQGAPPSIGPNETLIFKIHLIKVL